MGPTRVRSTILAVLTTIALALAVLVPAGAAQAAPRVKQPYLAAYKWFPQIGAPVANATKLNGGGVQRFQRGSIYTSRAGTHVVIGEILKRYGSIGAERSFLGYPTTSELPIRGGAVTHFQSGSIYWSPSTGAQVVWGAIRDKWASTGWENGFLGYPTTSEIRLRGGALNHFQNGSIYWSPSTGAQVVWGAIRDKWASTGWENGFLGYPTTSEVQIPGGAYNHFQGGSVYWSPSTGAQVVFGSIRDKWASLGWETGTLGYPTSGELPVADGVVQHFQKGDLYWSSSTGAHLVPLALRELVASKVYAYGLPTADAVGSGSSASVPLQYGTVNANGETSTGGSTGGSGSNPSVGVPGVLRTMVSSTLSCTRVDSTYYRFKLVQVFSGGSYDVETASGRESHRNGERLELVNEGSTSSNTGVSTVSTTANVWLFPVLFGPDGAELPRLARPAESLPVSACA